MVVCLLACVNVCKADEIYLSIYLGRTYTPVPGNNLTTTFGDDLDVSYTLSIYNETMDYDLPVSSLSVYLTDENGNTQGPVKYGDIKKLPAKTYKVQFKCQGSNVHCNYSTLVVKKRPIMFVSQHSALFYCMYNGGRTFKLADYDDGTGNDAGKQQWYTAFSLGNLASFDESTQIDFDKTTFEFNSPEASESKKDGMIHWALKADPNKTEDWTANYECQNFNKEACECENAFEGYILNKCPYEISWINNGTTVSENVSLYYGMKVGAEDYATQSYYDLVPLMYDNGNLVDESMKIEISQSGLVFTPYTEGTVMSAGDYVFMATSVNNSACKSQINVTVKKLIIMPTLDKIVTEKNYDGTTKVLEYSEYGTPRPAFLEGDDIKIIPTVSYDSPEVGDRQITVDFSMEGTGVENYEMLISGLQLPGNINPIQPTVSWWKASESVSGSTSIAYGEPIKNVTAKLELGEFDKYRDHYSTTAKYEVYDNGTLLEDNAALVSGKTYQLKAIFESDMPNNLLAAVSTINVTVKKIPIELSWFGDQNNLEYQRDKVDEQFGYRANFILENSDVEYQYYMSKDLSISDEDLFADENNKVPNGYAPPEVRKYKFGCIATDKNGYMDDCRIATQIEIKKSSVLMKIDEPTIETKRDYEDGNVQAKVMQPARFNGRDLPTTAYFVDGITASDIVDFKADVTESNFTEEVGEHFVFYKIDIPEDMAKNSNYYIKSERKSNGDIRYYEYKSGEYIYVTNKGKINCMKIVLEPDIPENAIYGDCKIGGETPNDVRIFQTYKDQIISVEGEWDFYGVPSGRYEPGTILDAKDYKMSVWFESHDDRYCSEASTDNFSFTVQPRELTSKGELRIADKTYDGTTTINSNQIIEVPTFEGILEKDLSEVSVNWDYTDTKYPSPDIKYTDETKTVLAAYTYIPATASLSGNRASNYQLPQTIFYGSSTILPEINIEIEYISPQPPEDVLTYRLVYGKSVMGVDFRVKDALLTDGLYARYLLDYTTDRTFKMQSPKENPDEFFNYEVQIVKGNRDEDAADNTYDVVARQRVRIYVDKYQLKISTPNIVKQKIYDGNTSVAWTNGNNCKITNAVEGDDVALDGEPVIVYDTPEVGTGKTITATYTLKGSDLYKYLMPGNYTTTGSITKEEVTPPDPPNPPNPPDPPVTGNIVIVDVTPVSGGATVTPNEDGYCAGERIMLNIRVSEGIPVSGSIEFSDESQKAGFKNVNNSDVTNLGNGMFQMAFDCPNASYGKYGGTVKLMDEEGHVSNGYGFELQVNYSSKYLKAKFYDVVLVDNHEQPRLFSESNPDISYKWYVREDGVDRIIPDETKQFYNVSTFDAWYGAFAKTSNEEWVKICPKYFGKSLSKSSVQSSVTVYPNPAASMEPITIRLNDFDTDSSDNVTIYIYNSTGSLVKTLENVEVLNTVALPFGNYSGVVAIDGKRISFKFIVRN